MGAFLPAPVEAKMEKLRPCPFCGSDLVTLIERKPRMYPWVVMCHDCGAEAAVDLGQSGAIEAWNKRSLEDDLLAAAKKALEFLTHAQFDFSVINVLFRHQLSPAQSIPQMCR